MATLMASSLELSLHYSYNEIHSSYQVSSKFKHKKTHSVGGVAAASRNPSIRIIKVTSKPRDKKNINGNGMVLSKQYRRLKQAVDNLHSMRYTAVFPDSNTYISVLQRCKNLKALKEGCRVHTGMIKTGFKPDIYLENNILTMYVKCGNLLLARQMFDNMRDRDEVSWTVMVSGYAQNGLENEALCLFYEMQRAGIYPNKFTFVSILKVCASVQALEQGKQVHASIIKNELDSNVYLGSALVDMYAKCGRLDEARHMFDKISLLDNVSWAAIIGGYAHQGYGGKALMLFQEMQRAGMNPNTFALSSILNVCARLDIPENGRQIHAYIIKTGFDSNVYVGSALVDMYAKCGNLANAHLVFDKMPERDAVSWTVLIKGYEQLGFWEEALMLLCQLQREGVKVDEFILSSALNACRNVGAIQLGKCVHALAIRSGMETKTHVASAIIHMYAEYGNIESANRTYHRMPKHDSVVNTAILAAYSKHGNSNKVFGIFQKMHREGMKPDEFSCASVLSSCASLAALEQGKQVHVFLVKNGLESEVITQSALIHMYSKSGNIEEARRVFDETLQTDVILWNAMIIGYSKHGYGKEALQLFEQMLKLGMTPDDVSFVGVLCACSHAGLIDEGRYYFDSMSRDHGITPNVKHYSCMVDLLGRAGRLNEAYGLIRKMPFHPDAAVWGSLLSGCRVHTNMGLGRVAAEHLFELEPQNYGNYRVLSNLYAASGRWDDVEKVRKMMKERGVKESGCSWIEVNNNVHTFFVGDKSHPQTKDIYAALDILANLIKDEGYVSDSNIMLHDVGEEKREHTLGRHSEKLAIAFGLISTPPGTSIRIVKNIPMCGDCHTATKFISKIVGREIILRDSNCFHHFKDGFCSCGCYW